MFQEVFSIALRKISSYTLFIWSFRPLKLALFEKKKEFRGAIFENLLFKKQSFSTAKFDFFGLKKTAKGDSVILLRWNLKRPPQGVSGTSRSSEGE